MRISNKEEKDETFETIVRTAIRSTMRERQKFAGRIIIEGPVKPDDRCDWNLLRSTHRSGNFAEGCDENTRVRRGASSSLSLSPPPLPWGVFLGKLQGTRPRERAEISVIAIAFGKIISLLHTTHKRRDVGGNGIRLTRQVR